MIALEDRRRHVMLSVHQISVIYKNHKVLNEISFDLEPGDVCAVAGANGAGKTTLINTLATKGYSKYQQGTIEYGEMEHSEDFIGYIPQEIALFQELTVLDNFKIFGKVKALNDQQVKEVIDVLDLEPWLDYRVSKISGGTKRRLNIGVELVRQPEMIFMDEPIVGIDYKIRKKIVRYIKELSNRKKIIMIASHNLNFLQQCSNKLLKLEKGEKHYFGVYNNEVL